MNTREAFQALFEGKKVRGTDWRAAAYMYFDDVGDLVFVGPFGGCAKTWNFLMDEGDEFEIYQFPECACCGKITTTADCREITGVKVPGFVVKCQACGRVIPEAPAKKKLYKALFQDSAGFYFSPARLFESDECARDCFSSGTFIQLLDEYVEVDNV